MQIMDLIRRLFGGANKSGAATPSQLDARADSKFIESDPQATKRRELVRVLTRDTQRGAGIPDGWIDSQVLLERGRGDQTFVHLRLIVKHWDERLLRYTVAFQRRLRTEIEILEPGARSWLLSITWQVDADGQCPYLVLPDPASWTEDKGTPQAAKTIEPVAKPKPRPVAPDEQEEDADQVRADLARLFAVRDAELTAPVWEATQPADIPELGPGPDHDPSQGRAKR